MAEPLREKVTSPGGDHSSSVQCLGFVSYPQPSFPRRTDHTHSTQLNIPYRMRVWYLPLSPHLSTLTSNYSSPPTFHWIFQILLLLLISMAILISLLCNLQFMGYMFYVYVIFTRFLLAVQNQVHKKHMWCLLKMWPPFQWIGILICF